MKIGILNNAANYLYFNINLARYLHAYGYEVVFLNTDLFISYQLRKKKLTVEKYKTCKDQIQYYNEESEFIKYIGRLNNVDNIRKLVNKKNNEYTACYNHLINRDFDYILILNGSFDVETDVCKNLSIKTFFFEHSYFSNSIQMDTKGVNSNASFAELSLNELFHFHYKKREFQVLKNFSFEKVSYSIIARYIFRLFDSKYNSFFKGYLKKKRNSEIARKRFESFKKETIKFSLKEKFIFFPLQVNSDTQIILNSKYSSMYNAIEDILPVLKKTGFKIIIKEHPKEVEPTNYSKYEDGKQVFVVKKVDINLLIENSEFVVNINSSVGMQSIAKYKKVLLLGNSFYKNSPLSIYYPDIEPSDLLNKMESLIIEKGKVDSYISHFKNEIFINDHFYNPTVDLFEKIRIRLI